MSFEKLCTKTATTKRVPAMVAGERGEAVAYLTTAFKLTPLLPVSMELAQRLELGTPIELLQTFVYNQADITEGDILVMDGSEYPIKFTGAYIGYPSIDEIPRLHLIVEDAKR